MREVADMELDGSLKHVEEVWQEKMTNNREETRASCQERTKEINERLPKNTDPYIRNRIYGSVSDLCLGIGGFIWFRNG